MGFLLLGIGGACGAAARYRLGAFLLKRERHTFPLGTFSINTAGTLLLGFVCGLGIDGNLYLLLGDGFCGAFTTFSTFAVENVQFIRDRAAKKAWLFLLASVAAGIGCFLAGYMLGTVVTGRNGFR